MPDEDGDTRFGQHPGAPHPGGIQCMNRGQANGEGRTATGERQVAGRVENPADRDDMLGEERTGAGRTVQLPAVMPDDVGQPAWVVHVAGGVKHVQHFSSDANEHEGDRNDRGQTQRAPKPGCPRHLQRQTPPVGDLAEITPAAERQHAHHEYDPLNDRHPRPRLGQIILHRRNDQRTHRRPEHGAQPSSSVVNTTSPEVE